LNIDHLVERTAVKSGYKPIRVRIADVDRVFRPMPTVDPNEFRYRW